MNRTVTQQRTGGRASRTLKSFAAIAALLCAAPAMADIVNFDAVPPSIYEGGSTLESNGYSMAFFDSEIAQFFGVVGGVGAVINSTDLSSCDIAACPKNGTGNYLGVLNDGSVLFSRASKEGGFTLNGFKVAFVPPVTIAPGTFGQLLLSGSLYDGSIVNTIVAFPPTAVDGSAMFGAAAIDASFRQKTFSSLSMKACLFDGLGGCNNSLDMPAGNQAQFALDDISFADVPEPGSFFLVGLGLAAFGLSRRRAGAKSAVSVNA